MSDVIVIVEGATRWEITGLRSRGEAILHHARRLTDQLADRCRAANDVLSEFEGDAAQVFKDQCGKVHGALAVTWQIIAEAADTCLRFPDPGSAPYPQVAQLAPPSPSPVLSANPVTLRAFDKSTYAWDHEVKDAQAAVTLDGVSATISYKEEVWQPDGTSQITWTVPEPLHPGSLVRLPDDVNRAIPNLLSLSDGAAALAELTALAVVQADSYASRTALAGERSALPALLLSGWGRPARAGSLFDPLETSAQSQLGPLIDMLGASGGHLRPAMRWVARAPRETPSMPANTIELRDRVVERSGLTDWSEWEQTDPDLFRSLNLSMCAYVLCYESGELYERSRSVRLTLDDGSYADAVIVETKSTFRTGLGLGIGPVSVAPSWTTREFSDSLGTSMSVQWTYNDVDQCITSEWQRRMRTREDNDFLDWVTDGKEELQ